MKKVSVFPYWVPTCQFAGYYVGKEKGIFKKHGIELEILDYTPFVSSSEIIRSGNADFALLWLANAIELRDKGINIVNIAQFSTRSSLMLLAKKSSGIKTLQDMDGKRAGIWEGFEMQPKALFSKYKLNVKIVPIGSTNNLFLQDGVEITTANWFDEYHTVINNGYNEEELVKFFFADYGMNFLEDGIYCLEDKVMKDPDGCIQFVKASMESWEYALNHPEESVQVILKEQRKKKMPANRSHQQWMIERYRDLYLPEGKKELNTLLPDSAYMYAAELLYNNKLIGKIIPYTSFYRPFDKLLNPQSKLRKNP